MCIAYLHSKIVLGLVDKFSFNADPDPAFHSYADTDLGYRSYADPVSKNYANLDPQPCFIQHIFIRRPSDSMVSEDAEVEPRDCGNSCQGLGKCC